MLARVILFTLGREPHDPVMMLTADFPCWDDDEGCEDDDDDDDDVDDPGITSKLRHGQSSRKARKLLYIRSRDGIATLSEALSSSPPPSPLNADAAADADSAWCCG